MRIAIDARFYGPFGKGLGRYVQKLIEHLASTANDTRYTVLLRKENWDAFQPHDARFTKQLADIPWYSLAEQVRLPRLLARGKYDLVHFPHYNVPLFYRKPFIVTVHDLILSHYPTIRASTLHPLLYKLKHAAYQIVIRFAVRRAVHVLTVSEFSKQQIVKEFGVPEERITVTYQAAERFPGEPDAATTAMAASLSPYLLYVGNAYPHKNLEGLLDAFAILHSRRRETPKLVLVGKPDFFYERIRAFAEERGLGDSVVFPGGVSDGALAALYTNAFLYVFPSFEEGFGLPPLEAMLYGTPVLAARASCLPEVLGDAAAYFDPRSPTAMAEAMDRLIDDAAAREVLRARGADRVARYSWDRLARTTADVYTECGRRSPYA